MYLKITLIFCLINTVSILAQSAGHDGTRGGGAALSCPKKVKGGIVNEYLPYDLFYATKTGKNVVDPSFNQLDDKGCASRLRHISEEMKRHVSMNDLASSLDRYIDKMPRLEGDKFAYPKNETLSEVDFAWDVYKTGVNELAKENEYLKSFIKIPAKCEKELVQIVARSETNVLHSGKNYKTITFQASEDVLKTIHQDPLKCSFLHIHEWLRSFVSDAHTIAKLNGYLHNDFHDNGKNEEQKILSLKRLGLFSEGDIFLKSGVICPYFVATPSYFSPGLGELSTTSERIALLKNRKQSLLLNTKEYPSLKSLTAMANVNDCSRYATVNEFKNETEKSECRERMNAKCYGSNRDGQLRAIYCSKDNRASSATIFSTELSGEIKKIITDFGLSDLKNREQIYDNVIIDGKKYRSLKILGNQIELTR